MANNMLNNVMHSCSAPFTRYYFIPNRLNSIITLDLRKQRYTLVWWRFSVKIIVQSVKEKC